MSRTTPAPTSWTRCCDAQRHRHRDRLVGNHAHGAPYRRNRDATPAARDHRRTGADRAHSCRCRLHVRRELRLHLRRDLLVRQQPRRPRRVAAETRLTRGDGRRVGTLRGVAPPAPRRHRDRGGHRLGPLVDGRSRADLPDGDGPVLPRAARRRPVELRGAAGTRVDRRRQDHRARHGGGRGAQSP